MAAKNPKFFILISQTIHHPKYQKKKKDTGILGLITYCSSCRIHLIGSEIVQSISSCLMGVLRQVERMGPPLVCEYACVWESEREERGALFAWSCHSCRYECSVSVTARSMQYANRRMLRATSGRKRSTPPTSVIFPSHNSLPMPLFLLKENPTLKYYLNINLWYLVCVPVGVLWALSSFCVL